MGRIGSVRLTEKLMMVSVEGFERGKEDLLPLPLKEDSHSISKSKVREPSL